MAGRLGVLFVSGSETEFCVVGVARLVTTLEK